jgi:hypothetical protein
MVRLMAFRAADPAIGAEVRIVEQDGAKTKRCSTRRVGDVGCRGYADGRGHGQNRRPQQRASAYKTCYFVHSAK